MDFDPAKAGVPRGRDQGREEGRRRRGPADNHLKFERRRTGSTREPSDNQKMGSGEHAYDNGGDGGGRS